MSTRKSRSPKKDFTPDDDKLIIENPKKYTSKELAEIIGCSRNQIEYRKMQLGVFKNKFWTSKEIQDVKKMYEGGMKAKQIADIYNVSVSSVYQLTQRYDIFKWRLVRKPNRN